MAYECHITRADLWVYDKEPITFTEIKALKDLPEGFETIENCTVTENTPFGETSIKLDKCIVYTRPDGVKMYLLFTGGTPTFKIRSEEDIRPFIELAKLLGAKVQGDEGEIYE